MKKSWTFVFEPTNIILGQYVARPLSGRPCKVAMRENWKKKIKLSSMQYIPQLPDEDNMILINFTKILGAFYKEEPI